MSEESNNREASSTTVGQLSSDEEEIGVDQQTRTPHLTKQQENTLSPIKEQQEKINGRLDHLLQREEIRNQEKATLRQWIIEGYVDSLLDLIANFDYGKVMNDVHQKLRHQGKFSCKLYTCFTTGIPQEDRDMGDDVCRLLARRLEHLDTKKESMRLTWSLKYLPRCDYYVREEYYTIWLMLLVCNEEYSWSFIERKPDATGKFGDYESIKLEKEHQLIVYGIGHHYCARETLSEAIYFTCIKSPYQDEEEDEENRRRRRPSWWRRCFS